MRPTHAHRENLCCEISSASFRHLQFLRLHKTILEFLSPPFQKSAKVHHQKYRTARDDRVTADIEPERYPTNARHHKDEEAELVLITEQKYGGQTTGRREPIDAVILKQVHPISVPGRYRSRS